MLISSFQNVKGCIPENLILIDNSRSQFKSCAEAYNTVIERNIDKINDIIIFIHPDMAFDNDVFEKRIVAELKDNPNQILCLAGKTDTYVYTNLKHRQTKENIAMPLSEKKECISADECCFAMTKELFMNIKFDEEICDNWHLYAVDFCYEAKRRGIKTYIIPEPMYHKENSERGLTADNHFIQCMRKLTKKYRNDFDCIKSTCYSCPTSGLWRQIHLAASWFHNVRYGWYRKLNILPKKHKHPII